MELLEDEHHLRLKQLTGQLNKKKILIWLIWARNNHLWHTHIGHIDGLAPTEHEEQHPEFSNLQK
eukprot:1421840-Prorocentrum_lima.AAC.1